MHVVLSHRHKYSSQYIVLNVILVLVTVAAQSEVFCVCSPANIEGSFPTGGMDMCLLVLCVVS
jgi:hypothetical protein